MDPLSLDALKKDIQSEFDRNRVLTLLATYLKQTYPFAAIFTVRGLPGSAERIEKVDGPITHQPRGKEIAECRFILSQDRITPVMPILSTHHAPFCYMRSNVITWMGEIPKDSPVPKALDRQVSPTACFAIWIKQRPILSVIADNAGMGMHELDIRQSEELLGVVQAQLETIILRRKTSSTAFPLPQSNGDSNSGSLLNPKSSVQIHPADSVNPPLQPIPGRASAEKPILSTLLAAQAKVTFSPNTLSAFEILGVPHSAPPPPSQSLPPLGANTPVPRPRIKTPPPIGKSQPSVIVDLGDAVNNLVTQVRDADPKAVRKLWPELDVHGAPVLVALVQALPGHLVCDPQLTSPVVPEKISSVAYAISCFGEDATPYLLPLLDDDALERRLCALLLLHALPDPNHVRPLGRRLYDTNPSIRTLAAHAIKRYEHGSEYEELTHHLNRVLTSQSQPLQRRIWTVDALLNLRHEGSLTTYLELLFSDQSPLHGPVSHALTVLTGADLGLDKAAWKLWVDQHQHHSRAEWLLKAMEQPGAVARAQAANELTLLLGTQIHFKPTDSEEERFKTLQQAKQLVASWKPPSA